jgi:hypothetical protein
MNALPTKKKGWRCANGHRHLSIFDAVLCGLRTKLAAKWRR